MSHAFSSHAVPQAGTSPATRGRANIAEEQTDQNLREDRKFLRSNGRVLRRVRALYPVKTAHYLHQITGFPLRTCEYWLGKDRLPSEAVWGLLHSDHGMEFLIEAMGDARPKWWTWLARVFLIVDVMRQRAASEALFRSAMDTSSEAFDFKARAEAALSSQDPDFHGPHIDACRTFARVCVGALAQAEKD